MKRSRAHNSSSSRGAGANMGDETEASPFCSVCMNDEFYEDDQGGMICVTCGTQSQDFLAEGFDEDDLAVYGGGTGNMVTMRNESGRGTAATKSGEKAPLKTDEVPDILEALKLYQFTLQMVFDACLVCSNAQCTHMTPQEVEELNASYRTTLKSVWMDYLNQWNVDKPTLCVPVSSSAKRVRIRSHQKCSIGVAFTRSTRLRCKCNNVGSATSHPLLPSKPLLLGLIYLTYRIMRSAVLVCDIVRWCETGQVPYANLWETIPTKWRDSVRVNMKWFYDIRTSKSIRLIKPENILFHACSVAQSVRVDLQHTDRAQLPALNAPLVARHIINSLGLPLATVWDMYVKVTQLFTTATPINGAQMLEQHHEENIMAVLIVAIKFCPRWTEWVLLHTPSGESGRNINNISKYSGNYRASTEVVPVPESLAELSSVRRVQLPQLLQQIRRTNKLYSTQSESRKLTFPFNIGVYAALGGDVERLNKGLGQHHQHLQHQQSQQKDFFSPHSASSATHHTNANSETPQWSALMSYADSAHTSSVALQGDSLVTEDLSLKDRRRLSYLNGIEPHKTRTSKHTEQSAYMAYTRYNNDHTSIMHMQYLVLLERCAKYLYTNPSLLHDLVSKLEEQIVSLAFTGSSTNSIKPNSVGSVEEIKPKHRIMATSLKDVMVFREKCDIKLPRLHKQSAHAKSALMKQQDDYGSGDSDTDASAGHTDNKKHYFSSYDPVAPLVFNPHGDFMDIEYAFGTQDLYAQYADSDVHSASRKRRRSSKKTEDGVSAAVDRVGGAGEEAVTTGAESGDGGGGGGGGGAGNISESDFQYDTNDATSDYNENDGDDDHHDGGSGFANHRRAKPLSVDYLRDYAISQAKSTSASQDAPPVYDPRHHHHHHRHHSDDTSPAAFTALSGSDLSGSAASASSAAAKTSKTAKANSSSSSSSTSCGMEAVRTLREDILQTMLAGQGDSDSDSDNSAQSFDPLRYARYTSQDNASQHSQQSEAYVGYAQQESFESQLGGPFSSNQPGAVGRSGGGGGSSSSSAQAGNSSSGSNRVNISSRDVTQRPVVALKRPRSQVQFQD